MENREVSWPAKRRLRLISSGGMAGAGGISAATRLVSGEFALGVLGLLLAACGAYLLLDAARCRVETTADGLRVVGPFGATRIPWHDLAEIRPNGRAPWGDRLLAVRKDGEIVKLPLPPTDDVVNRWKRATATDCQ
ncbi:PH domain-containing protein [Kribbella sp. NPDC051952]|uniref:PH domain-containing protein n=1 Tax=Kribbella sp. NPDC051952 TaxID=3154851 RepID=UPI00341999A6